MKTKTSKNSIHISNVHDVTLYKEAKDHVLSVSISLIFYYPDAKYLSPKVVTWLAIERMSKLAELIFVEVIIFESHLYWGGIQST